jgi:hypothetical protein
MTRRICDVLWALSIGDMSKLIMLQEFTIELWGSPNLLFDEYPGLFSLG